MPCTDRKSARITLLIILGLVTFMMTTPSQSWGQSAEAPPIDSSATTPTTGAYRMSKSPTKAILYGLIPGGGQVYTEQYLKIPLFLIPLAGTVSWGIYSQIKFSDFASQAEQFPSTSGEYAVAVNNRELYRDRRDLAFAISGGIYILSIIDAYVGAHLYDFDVDDSLAYVRLYPDPVHCGIALTARW